VDVEIDKAPRACKGVILVLTPASVDSENVMDEVSFDLDEKKALVPLLFQDCDDLSNQGYKKGGGE
jgi:hypothetical protein